jgi:hypothetical protein
MSIHSVKTKHGTSDFGRKSEKQIFEKEIISTTK